VHTNQWRIKFFLVGTKNSLAFSKTKNYISFIKNGNKKLKIVKLKGWVKLVSIYSLLFFTTIYIHLNKKIILWGQDLFFMGQKKNIYSIYSSKKLTL